MGMMRRAQREDPGLPPGYRVRPTGPGEHAARVDVHRAAWRPIDLPWGSAFHPTYPRTKRAGSRRRITPPSATPASMMRGWTWWSRPRTARGPRRAWAGGIPRPLRPKSNRWASWPRTGVSGWPGRCGAPCPISWRSGGVARCSSTRDRGRTIRPRPPPTPERAFRWCRVDGGSACNLRRTHP